MTLHLKQCTHFFSIASIPCYPIPYAFQLDIPPSLWLLISVHLCNAALQALAFLHWPTCVSSTTQIK